MWIESHQALLTHRKTGRLSRALSISKITAIGHLHAFWWWCMDNAPKGDLSGVDPEDIADGACWEGTPPGAFVEALVYAGFVDQAEDGSLSVHDWMDFAGKLVERREKDAERKRSARGTTDAPQAPLKDDSQQSQDIQHPSAGRPKDSAKTAYVPNRTEPNPTQPTEESALLQPEQESPVANESGFSGDGDAKLPHVGGHGPETQQERMRFVQSALAKKPHWKAALNAEVEKAHSSGVLRDPDTSRFMAGVVKNWLEGRGTPPEPVTYDTPAYPKPPAGAIPLSAWSGFTRGAEYGGTATKANLPS